MGGGQGFDRYAEDPSKNEVKWHRCSNYGTLSKEMIYQVIRMFVTEFKEALPLLSNPNPT